jgi:hypothetical protein
MYTVVLAQAVWFRGEAFLVTLIQMVIFQGPPPPQVVSVIRSYPFISCTIWL